MKFILTVTLLSLAGYLGVSSLDRIGNTTGKATRGDTSIVTTDNGHQTTTTSYIGGKKNGPEIVVFKNGDTVEIRNYKNDIYDGPITTFYPHHKVGVISFYKEGYKVGIWKRFDSLGNLEKETSFDGNYRFDDPRWSGKQKFYKDGQLIFIQVWQDGRRANADIRNQKLYDEYKLTDWTLGHTLFLENCAACHALKIQIVGPALSGIEQRRNKEWLIHFIRNSKSLLNSNDSISRSLYRKYNEIEHPDYSYFTRSDIEAVLDYIKNGK